MKHELYFQVLVCLILMIAISCTRPDEETVGCSNNDDCPNGYVCIQEDCRLSCKDRDCPPELPVCNEAGLCEPAPASSDGDLDKTDVDETDLDSNDNEKETSMDGDSDIDLPAEKDLDDDPVERTDQDKDLVEIELDEATEHEVEMFDIDLDDIEYLDTDSSDLDIETEVDPEEEDIPCECETGDCCNGCRLKAPGTLCDARVYENLRCVPDDPELCGDTQRQRQYVDQVCSGDSELCDGPLVPREEWTLIQWCSDDQHCTPEACIKDHEDCCECESGACCNGCKFRDENFACRQISGEYGCPDGTGPGSNVYRRSTWQHCTGSSDLCEGEVLDYDWYLHKECSENEGCEEHGGCVLLYCEENGSWGCAGDYYCREHVCHYANDSCNDIPPYECDSAEYFCNDFYWNCLPLAGPCEINDDCVNHPNGETCNPGTHTCVE